MRARSQLLSPRVCAEPHHSGALLHTPSPEWVTPTSGEGTSSRERGGRAAVCACAITLCLSACGSAELPPPAGPPPSPPATAAPAGRIVPGRTVAALPGPLRPRERTLQVGNATAPAGVGPTHAACFPRAWCYVTDTRGNALLVFRRGRKLELVRRYYLAGGPYGLALDARRRVLYVTLPGRNELVELPAHGRPHVLRRWPTPRAPREVSVDAATGRVSVGAAGVVQLLQPPTRRRPPR
jgi:hypothetical protein